MAWSPDSERLVLLTSTGHINFILPMDLLAFLLGYPSWTEAYSLEFFDASGACLGETKIASGFVGAGLACVEWLEE